MLMDFAALEFLKFIYLKFLIYDFLNNRMKDGKPIIPDGTHIKEIKSPDGTVTLLLDTCNLEDAGRYSLLAKNPLGEDTSSGNLDVTGIISCSYFA